MMYTEPPMEPPPAAEAAVSSFLRVAFLRLRCCRNLTFFASFKLYININSARESGGSVCQLSESKVCADSHLRR